MCCSESVKEIFIVLISFFFFKQKTAYEMRISDWSSDVCSSDLTRANLRSVRDDGDHAGRFASGFSLLFRSVFRAVARIDKAKRENVLIIAEQIDEPRRGVFLPINADDRNILDLSGCIRWRLIIVTTVTGVDPIGDLDFERSEEHTSELQ